MFARTERLLLRPGWAEDAPALSAAIDDRLVACNLTRVPSPYGLSDAQAFLAAKRPEHDAAPELVGAIGITRATCGGAELGYWIARTHWGRGYATEAGAAMIRIAHSLRVPRLVAGHFLDNPASGRVLRKLGFRATSAIGARHSLARGEEVPCAQYELMLPAAETGTPAAPCDMMAA
jgi:RimJ/RimL family protein N-acetyltransferase